jgi:23S rRNA (adenine2503-C2)-methyltransferase
MKRIFDLTFTEIQAELIKAGFKSFVADQLYTWIYKKGKTDSESWLNISKQNREKIKSLFEISLEKVEKQSGDNEGTNKVLIGLNDGMKVESVLIKEKNHYTFCISSQVGCGLGCKFCATGRMGFKRDLTSGEIISQILILRKMLKGFKGKINLVFMGMGEPLLNYENLKKSLQIITDPKGIGVSPRNITVSTAGILKYIKILEKDFPKIKLSFSLNASNAQMRKDLMPVSRKEDLSGILEYFRTKKRKHRITFEYVLIRDVNDRTEDAKKVSVLLQKIPCKINVIPYNENEFIPYNTPSEEKVDAFSEFLAKKGFTVMVRWSKGKDIKSACGQLAGE